MPARRVMSLIFLLSLFGAAYDPSRRDLSLPRMLIKCCIPVGFVNHAVSLYFLAVLQCFIVLCHFYMLLIRRITFTIPRIPLQNFNIVYFVVILWHCLLFRCNPFTMPLIPLHCSDSASSLSRQPTASFIRRFLIHYG